jgi:sulfur-oxidizing protein SoxY
VDLKSQNNTKPTRRQFLVRFCALGAALLILPLKALASVWNKPAFESATLADAIKNLNIKAEAPSAQIEIIAPDKAENGAVVQVEINSHIANTESITIFSEKNPTPLVAQYTFSNGALPYVVTRIKMAETCDLKAVIKANNQYFTASKRVEVLENGCG